MKNVKDVAVLVQARMSSERCPGKMARPFADTTLIDVIVDKIKKSKVIPLDNFYLLYFLSIEEILGLFSYTLEFPSN